MKVYERTIRNLVGRSPTEFREEQGREILAAKMRDLVLAPVRVSDAEAEDLYVAEKSSATVGSIAVKQSWVKRWAVQATPAEIDAYAKDATVAKEIENILKDRDPLDIPKQNHVRHILAKTPPSPSEDDLRKAAQKLADARARIAAGATFAEVARETSDDKASGFQGGDMGDRTMSPAFQDAVNALKPGEITKAAVQTPFGLELIMKDDPSKETDVRAALMKDFARELYLKSKSLEKAKDLASKLLADVQGGKKPEAAIAALIASLPKQAAEPKPLPIVRLPADADADAGASTAESADPTKSPTKSPTKNPTKSSPTDDVTGPGADPDRPQLITSSPFNKGGDPIGGLSPEAHNQLVTFAFAGKDGAWMKEPLRSDDGFLLVTLTDQKTATHDEFEKEKETFEQTLLLGKRAEAMSLHVKRLRDQAKDQVKIDESYIADLKGDAGAGGTGEDEDEEAP
jgi:parvulin-like peptidyl-prolyl isomerase